MNRTDPGLLLADLNMLIDQASGCLDVADSDARAAMANLINARVSLRLFVMRREPTEPEHERPSIPPSLLDSNQPKRRSAVEHFRKAREHTSEAVRRLRRER